MSNFVMAKTLQELGSICWTNSIQLITSAEKDCLSLISNAITTPFAPFRCLYVILLDFSVPFVSHISIYTYLFELGTSYTFVKNYASLDV